MGMLRDWSNDGGVGWVEKAEILVRSGWAKGIGLVWRRVGWVQQIPNRASISYNRFREGGDLIIGLRGRYMLMRAAQGKKQMIKRDLIVVILVGCSFLSAEVVYAQGKLVQNNSGSQVSFPQSGNSAVQDEPQRDKCIVALEKCIHPLYLDTFNQHMVCLGNMINCRLKKMPDCDSVYERCEEKSWADLKEKVAECMQTYDKCKNQNPTSQPASSTSGNPGLVE
ncbi:MAG: hypothetical protein RLZ25_1642 [Pseudomonadota bacterium]